MVALMVPLWFLTANSLRAAEGLLRFLPYPSDLHFHLIIAALLSILAVSQARVNIWDGIQLCFTAVLVAPRPLKCVHEALPPYEGFWNTMALFSGGFLFEVIVIAFQLQHWVPTLVYLFAFLWIGLLLRIRYRSRLPGWYTNSIRWPLPETSEKRIKRALVFQKVREQTYNARLNHILGRNKHRDDDPNAEDSWLQDYDTVSSFTSADDSWPSDTSSDEYDDYQDRFRPNISNDSWQIPSHGSSPSPEPYHTRYDQDPTMPLVLTRRELMNPTLLHAFDFHYSAICTTLKYFFYTQITLMIGFSILFVHRLFFEPELFESAWTIVHSVCSPYFRTQPTLSVTNSIFDGVVQRMYFWRDVARDALTFSLCLPSRTVDYRVIDPYLLNSTLALVDECLARKGDAAFLGGQGG